MPLRFCQSVEHTRYYIYNVIYVYAYIAQHTADRLCSDLGSTDGTEKKEIVWPSADELGFSI